MGNGSDLAKGQGFCGPALCFQHGMLSTQSVLACQCLFASRVVGLWLLVRSSVVVCFGCYALCTWFKVLLARIASCERQQPHDSATVLESDKQTLGCLETDVA